MCCLPWETSSCVAIKNSQPVFCHLNKSVKMDTSPSVWKADTLFMETTEETGFFSPKFSQLDCAKHWYPHPKNGKSLQCCARLRKGTPLQLYLQLFSALKTFLSGSSEMKNKSGLAPKSARWALERKFAISSEPQRTTFQEGKVPAGKKPVGKTSHSLIQPKLASLQLSLNIHSPIPWNTEGNARVPDTDEGNEAAFHSPDVCDICMVCLSLKFMPTSTNGTPLAL